MTQKKKKKKAQNHAVIAAAKQTWSAEQWAQSAGKEDHSVPNAQHCDTVNGGRGGRTRQMKSIFFQRIRNYPARSKRRSSDAAEPLLRAGGGFSSIVCTAVCPLLPSSFFNRSAVYFVSEIISTKSNFASRGRRQI